MTDHSRDNLGRRSSLVSGVARQAPSRRLLRLTLACLFILPAILTLGAPPRIVRVGAFNYYPGIFKDKDGVVKGFYVDALSEIQEKHNIRFEYVYGSWSEGLERIRSGQVDLLTSVAYTPERARFMDFGAVPLLTVWGELYVNEDSHIDGIREISGKKVALMKGDVNAEHFVNLVEKFGIPCHFVELPGFEEIFHAVAEGKVDAGVVNSTFGAAKQREYGLRSTGVVFNPFDIFFAAPKGENKDLLELLDNHLNQWRRQESSVYNRARQKWSHGTVGVLEILPRWLVNSALALLLVALAAIVFIILLRRQVLRATRNLLQREASLQESEARFRSYIDNSPDGIFVLDREGRFKEVNRAVCVITGYPESEILSKSIPDVLPPESLAYVMEQFELLKQRGQASAEFLFRHYDGTNRWCEVEAVKLSPTRMLGFVKDISERKRIELTYSFLAQAGWSASGEGFFLSLARYLAESLGMDFVCIDRLAGDNLIAETVALYQDGSLLENIRYALKDTPCGAMLGKNICCHPQNVRNLFPHDVYLQELKAESYVGATLWSYDGKPLGLIAVIGRKPLQNPRLAESVLKLVSVRAAGELERNQAEEEQARLEAQYLQAQKMEAVGRLAGGVAHDLNNLLSPILGYSELILDDLNADDAHRESLEQIIRAGERARDLVRQLLAFSRKQVMEFKPFDLNLAVMGFEKLLRRTIREDIAIEFIPEPSAPWVRGDIGQLEQVIMNLAVNAQDAMPDGGKLTIATSLATLAEHDGAEHRGVQPGRYVTLVISDTGQGMDDETRARLFEPFFTTKPLGQGTGLGLATTYGIIKQHEGAICVDSAPGKGTTFTVLLPALESSVASSETRPTARRQAVRGAETILLVEDNDVVRNVARAMIERQGYQVLIAQNGAEALDMLERHTGALDLLLTDIVMPDINGRQLFARARQYRPTLKVLYMSGYADGAIAPNVELDAGERFIAKPFSVQALAAKIREALER